MARPEAGTVNPVHGPLARYVLFQLPELLFVGMVLLVLAGMQVVSVGLGWMLLGLWVVKEVVLYPFVKRAYELSDPSGAASLLGARAVVTERLDPVGTVRVGPELWTARLEDGCEPVDIGQTVCVKSVEGLTLHVSRALD